MKNRNKLLKDKFIRRDMALSNIRYGTIYLLLTIITSIILLIVLLVGDLKASPFPQHHYIGLYSASIVGSLILFITGVFLHKNINKNTIKIMILSSIVVCFTTVWSAALGVVSIMENSKDILNIMTSLLYILVLSMILYVPFSVYVVSYFFHMVVIIGFDILYADASVGSWIYINMAVFYFFAILIVYARNKSKRETAATRKLSNEEIEDQRQQNQRMTKLIEELKIVSITDRLTGLYNRVFLDDSSSKIWEDGLDIKENIVVVMIDIDDFKAINDNYGHLAGDSCLKRISDLIKEYAISNNGLAFRYGGEEFLIIYKNYTVDDIKEIMTDLRASTEQIVIPKYPDITLNISLGIAGAVPNGKNNFYDIVTKADKILYEEKKLKGQGVKKYKR